MANGYQRGDYLTQFLQQLPQIYQAQQNMKLQEERLSLQKQTATQNQQYREELLKRNENEADLMRFRQETGALKDSPGALQAYIKQSPMMKNNPQLLAQYEADIERDDNLSREANRLWGYDPMGMVFESRKFLNMDGVSTAQAKIAREALNEGINRLTMTNQEFATTEAYFEYATLHDKLSTPDKWFVQDTPLPQKEAMMTEWGDRMS